MSGNYKRKLKRKRDDWLRRAYPSMANELDRLDAITPQASFFPREGEPDTELARPVGKRRRMGDEDE